MTIAKRSGALLLSALVVLACSGCERMEPTTAENQAIEATIHAYLRQLSVAYATRDVSALDGTATGGEQAAVLKLLGQLAGGGDRLDATLLQVEFEKVKVFREVNATVKLTEVWDIRRLDAFNGREKGRNPRSVQTSIVQLRLVDGTWLVTARQVLETGGKSRWGIQTPAAEPTERPG